MAQVVENFSSTAKKDGATTADWNTGAGRLKIAGGASLSQTRYSGSSTEYDPGGGTYYPWTNPAGARVSNGDVADIDLILGHTSKWLKQQSFGFEIPANAVITGMKVEILTAFQAGDDYWAGVRTIRGNSIDATSGHGGNSSFSPNTTNWTWNSFGGDGDMWGVAISPSTANASNFGAAYRQSDTANHRTYADDCRITLYYTYYSADLNVGQSTEMDATSQNIPRATLNKNDSVPGGMSVDYYLSNNGGTNWNVVTPGTEYTFSTTGADLRFKIVINGSYTAASPYIDDVTIDYVTTPISMSVSEDISLADDKSNKPSLSFADVVGLADSFSFIKFFNIVVNETLSVAEGIGKSVRIALTESMSLAESFAFKTPKQVRIAFNMVKNFIPSIRGIRLPNTRVEVSVPTPKIKDISAGKIRVKSVDLDKPKIKDMF